MLGMSLLLLPCVRCVCVQVCVCVSACVRVHVLAAPLPLLNMIESDCFHLRVNGSNLSVTSVAYFQQKDKIEVEHENQNFKCGKIIFSDGKN